jgi:hypothetical protein
MKGEIVTVRLAPEILYGIDEFQKKRNMAFRTDALVEIIKIACHIEGIDLSNIPAAPGSPDPIATEEEKEVYEWLCPQTGRVGDYSRCDRHFKQHPEECKTCKVIPEYYREIIFPTVEETGEETREGQAEEVQKPISTIDPQEKDTVEVQEPNSSDMVELQQAVIIKTLHDGLEKKPRIEENQKSSSTVPNMVQRERDEKQKTLDGPLFQIEKPKPKEKESQ